MVKLDDLLSEGGDRSPVSGQVVSVTKSEVVVREGRPYLISPGTQLLVEENSLVLRGDMLATLLYERQKQVISFKVFQELKNYLKVENQKIAQS